VGLRNQVGRQLLAQFNAEQALTYLASAASDLATHSEGLFSILSDYDAKLQGDRFVLQGAIQRWSGELAAIDRQTQQVVADLAQAQRELDQANSDYQHDVTVAATSPTYAWIWPFGTIAAAAVASKFGALANEAKGRAEDASRRIAGLAAQQQALASTHSLLALATSSAESLGRAYVGVQAAVQSAMGLWHAIAADLQSAATWTEAAETPNPLSKLDAAVAAQSWGQVLVLAGAMPARAILVDGIPAPSFASRSLL
jgi:hypothetical protein